MKTLFILFWVSITSIEMGSLQFPIRNGIIKQNRLGEDKLDKSVLISPTNDENIYSCSDGLALIVTKDEGGYTVGLKNNYVTEIYSLMDSVVIKKNQPIKKGQIIGFKAKETDNNYILFSVSILGKEVDAVDYLCEKSR